MDEFLDKRSELFSYYRKKEFQAVPSYIYSVEEAIEDH